jgi:RimJ/RimL family protein N-acetyltransferase
MTEDSERRFDVFIPGEVVDLCAPSDAPWVLDQWYRWFNDPRVTRYLAQGAFPNTLAAQRQFLHDAVSTGDRLVVLIRPKGADRFVGVASLSAINHVQRQCDYAMVIGEQVSVADSLFYALETKARLTAHAFEVLGSERINSSQAIELIRWQRWQILLGYQIEGMLRERFRKGHDAHHVLASSCLLRDYLELKELRGGHIWPGKARMFELLKGVPRHTLLDELVEWLPGRQREYWDTVFAPERTPQS